MRPSDTTEGRCCFGRNGFSGRGRLCFILASWGVVGYRPVWLYGDVGIGGLHGVDGRVCGVGCNWRWRSHRSKITSRSIWYEDVRSLSATSV
ncbi:MAG: hypothetical protein NC453_26090 [Muribaculum sp.]|nr:hypothetical protein [Muribaculum sp.]